MSARKRPVATGTPSAARPRTNASIERLGLLGPGRRDPTRPAAAHGVAVERELAARRAPRRRCRAATGSSRPRRRRRRAGSRPSPRASRRRPRRRRGSRRRARTARRRSRRRPRRRRATARLGHPLHRARAKTLRSGLLRRRRSTCPSRARPFMRARCRNAVWPAPAFASSPFQAFSAACCSARPYENDSCHGCGPELVDRVEVRGRLLVALAAGQEHDAGHRGGHDLAEARDRRVGDRLGRRRAARVTSCPGSPCSASAACPSSSTRCVVQRVEHRVQRVRS